MTARITSQFIVRFFIGLVLIVAGASLVWFFKSLAATIALAGVAYLILDGPTRVIQHQGVPRGQAILIVILIAAIMILSSVLFAGSTVFQDLNEIRAGLPNLRERVQGIVSMVEISYPDLDIREYITPDRLQSIQSYFVSIITSVIAFFGNWIFNVLFIIPLLTILLLTTGHTLKVTLFDLIPNSYFEMTVTVFDNIMETIREYVFAKFLESVVIAIICVIGFLLFGVPGAIVLGILAGVLNLIPYFGPLISVVPPVIMAILKEDLSLAIAAGLIIAIAQVVDNVVLQPVLISKAVNVHPFIVVVVTFMGAELFGAVGMVIAIPIYTISKILVINLYHFLGSVQRRSVLEESEQALRPMMASQSGLVR